MRFFGAAFLALALTTSAFAQKRTSTVPEPEKFGIGRHTFFDFGPPFDYYELLLVRSIETGSSVERILLTPPGDACYAPAKVETSTGTIGESVPTLLGKTNPCSIPEKELHRELKRCKKCLVFSGANVTMRFQCGESQRLIRSDILDKDIFGSDPRTPEHTSWTMQLLRRLDQSLGPGVMDKPMFTLPSSEPPPEVNLNSSIRKNLESGAYDELFPKAGQKPSELYLSTLIHPPPPTAKLLSSIPFAPQEFVQPDYPPWPEPLTSKGKYPSSSWWVRMAILLLP